MLLNCRGHIEQAYGFARACARSWIASVLGVGKRSSQNEQPCPPPSEADPDPDAELAAAVASQTSGAAGGD